MLLVLTTIDKQAQFRDFVCLLSTLELVLDSINAIALTGDPIIKAQLIEEGKGRGVFLPIDGFDGQPVSQQLQALEKQWQQILNQSGRGPADSYLTQETVG